MQTPPRLSEIPDLNPLVLSRPNREESSAAGEAANDLPELTAEEILEFRKQKLYAMQRESKRAEYLSKMMAPKFPTISTPGQFVDYCEARLQTIVDIDDDNRLVVMKLASYFAGLRNKFTEDLDFDKGIMLYGRVGTGKTTLMQLMCESVHAPFYMVAAQEIVNRYQQEGVSCLNDLSGLQYNHVSQKYFGNRHLGLCIDDIGTETEGKSYGNQKNVVGEIIMLRYQTLKGPFTHLTTNATRDELKAYYGLRVYDRMREMFNIVSFPINAESRRK